MADKMKCARCGQRFKQANRKQVLCAKCLEKERAAKKSGPQLVQGYTAGGAPHPASGPAQPPTITIVAATPPPEHGAFGPQARYAERQQARDQTRDQARDQARDQGRHSELAHPASPAVARTTPHEPPRPLKAVPSVATAKPAAQQQQAPRQEKRAKKTRTVAPPFALTDESRAAIEARYLELSDPVEFDGIRTQIATELEVPKPLVKDVIRQLRISRQLPSWWELKAYKGSDETLERIRERYMPLLPLPPVGVHKQIAADLQLDAPQVYQAIRRLRAEMKLPQYNPPESHEHEQASTEPDAVADASPSAASE